MKKYKLVACGGTFDRLHKGHKDFLTFTVNLGEKVVLGLTSDTYIQTYKNGLGIEPFQIRKKILEEYLNSTQKRDLVEIISIDDHFGPTLSNDYAFDCLAVTESTEEMGAQINVQRQRGGMKPLPLRVFRLTLAEDSNPITSTRIRNGEIDREGNLYIKKEWLRQSLILPESLRDKLSKPLGKIIQDVPSGLDSNKIITVGDMVTKTFKGSGLDPRLSIIDLQTERRGQFKNVQDLGFSGNENIVRVKNPAGGISSELMSGIAVCIQHNNTRKTIIVVEGEEDLAVLPVVLYASLGDHVFYGQPVRLSLDRFDKLTAGKLGIAQGGPREGMVQVVITEKIKERVRALLEKFDIK